MDRFHRARLAMKRPYIEGAALKARYDKILRIPKKKLTCT